MDNASGEGRDKVVLEAARFTHVPADRARAFLSTLELCGYALVAQADREKDYAVSSAFDIATIKHGVRMLEAISVKDRKRREQLTLGNPDAPLSFAKHNACAVLLRLANRELKRTARPRASEGGTGG